MSDIPKLVAELRELVEGPVLLEREQEIVINAIQALEQMADIREAAMQDCWNAVDDLIVEGHLVEPWRNEQRSGFVLATNAITALIDKERSVRKAEGMTIPYTDSQGKRDE